MKRILLVLLPALLCACSSPRYSYYFDSYDYSEGRKPQIVQLKEKNNFADIQHTESDLMADVSKRIVLEDRTIINLLPSGVNDMETYAGKDEHRNIESLTKFSRKERREFIRDLKDAIRESKKNPHQTHVAPDEIKVMDKDLKMAIIFGAVGLTLSLFTGVHAAFGVLGVVAIVVGVVFLVRWLIRQ
jgi:hypothetical protein